MTTAYILVLWFGSSSISMQDFDSKITCEEAKNIIYSQLTDYRTHPLIAECLKK